MKFFMISDLHLGKGNDVDKAKNQLIDLCALIRTQSYPKEILLFIIMGDVINASDIDAYEDAKECLDCIKEELSNYEVRFEFIPGNHDLPSGDIGPFNNFVANYSPSCSFATNAAYSVQYEGINFIFADTNLFRDHRMPGMIDLNEIYKEVKDGTNLLFTHHAFEQNYGGDHDTIQNPKVVLNELKSMGVSFVFHGHTHRSDVTETQNGIVEIGCGTLLKDISDMDGIQNQFSVGYTQEGEISRVDRIVVAKDGGNVYPSATIYPESRTFVDPRTVNQILYDKPEEYIRRCVVLHDATIQDEYARLFSKVEEITLRNALKKDKKILLLSDAGYGKSIEMENLAFELCEERYFPYLIKLRNYTNAKIADLLPEAYRKLSQVTKVLLFDGYDELSLDSKLYFEKELRAYLEENIDSNVVISSRSNFCRTEKAAESKTFPGFKTYNLCKLSRTDIDTYIQGKGINAADFFYEVRMANIFSLLENPFYLIQIRDLFLKEKNLPPKSELMEKLIVNSFEFDDGKFDDNLEQSYEELMQLLGKLAMAMQLVQQSKLEDRTDYQKLFNKQNRELLQHSGLLSKEASTWQFVHNNFREYLAAKYLSELTQEEVLAYISVGSDINPSWFNVLGFLTEIPLTWDLTSWIVENNPEALVKYNPDTLATDVKSIVFESIFLHYEKKHLWFNRELCNEEEFAHFAESPTTLQFLLNRIANPISVVSQYTAISILRFFKNLYGRQEEVLLCLLGCCKKYPQTRKDVCRLAILAICELNLANKDVTNQLMDLFGNCEEDYIRLGMYEYLTEVNEHNEYVDFFLDGTKYIIYKTNDSDNRIGNESFELTNGLKQMSTIESVCAVISYLVKNDSDFYDVDEIFEILINNAIELYKRQGGQLYNVVLESCIKSLQKYDHRKVKSCVAFFEQTNTFEMAGLVIVDALEEEIHFMSDMMYLHPELPAIVYSAYVQKKFNNHSAFKNLVEHYVGDEILYKNCLDAIEERSNLKLRVFAPVINYEEVRRKEEQKYFDVLFAKESAEKMLMELLDKMDHTEIKIEKVLDKSVRASWESALRQLQVSIYHYGDKEWMVRDFFSKIDFERFNAMEIKKHLGEKSDIVVSVEQRDYIVEMVKQKLNKELLKRELRQDEEGTVVSKYLMALIFLAMKFGVVLSEEILLELTKIPAAYFETFKLEKKNEFLLKHISESKLRECIDYNLKGSKISKMLLEDYIDYCADTKIELAVNVSLALCQSNDTDEWLQWHAFEYLYALYGVEYISEYILPHATGEFLLRIVQECKALSTVVACSFLEKEYEINPSYELMTELIKLGSEVAIKKYVEMVISEHSIPEEKSYFYSGTSAIATIKDTKLLYLLEQLLDVVLVEDFVDDEFWGLRNSLSKAFVNCGIDNPDDTIAIIEKRLNEFTLEENNIRYCNYMIEDIKSNRKKYNDKPKTIKQVKLLLGLG